MTAVQKRSVIAIFVVLVLTLLLALAGGQQGKMIFGFSLFAVCAILAFVVQWLAFIPAYLFQTERYYDLTGSLTYLLVVFCALILGGYERPHALLLAVLIGVWAVRLGSFLFVRIIQDGSDSRFDEIKPVFLRFLLTWTLQAFWVCVTAGSALAAITSGDTIELDWFTAFGLLVWLTGFLVEVIADQQKRTFRAQHGNQIFINTGLWAYSRHPNYFGEIVLWIGISIIAFPALTGWQYVTLISPVFVFLLLTRVSGIPLLEAKSEKRWGGDPDYESYRKTTPALIPGFGKNAQL